jgi:hypothetical protein
MALDERARHRLYERLQEVLGAEEAEILMEHLPPVGWADVSTKRDLDALAVVTKRDLDALAASLRAEMQTSEQRMLATFRAELLHQTRTIIFSLVAALATVGGLAVAAARAM